MVTSAIAAVVAALGSAYSVPGEPPVPPWTQPFAVVAGGGTTQPAPGVVAGQADLGTVVTAARASDGRVILSTPAALWAVERDGRLSAITGVSVKQGDSLPQMTVLGDGSLAIVSDSSVYDLPAGGHAATLLATVKRFKGGAFTFPLGIGTDAGGRLLAIAGGHVLRLAGDRLLDTGRKLFYDDGITDARGIWPARGGLVGGTRFPNSGIGYGTAPGDTGAVLFVGATGKPRVIFNPDGDHAVRSVAALPSGRVLAATDDIANGDFDRRSLPLAAGKTVDRTNLGYEVGEEYDGWIDRRDVVAGTAAGSFVAAHWGGPPADWIAPDGDGDNVLAVSRGRVWTTRPGLAPPDVTKLWSGAITVRLGVPASVTASVLDANGKLLARVGGGPLPAGASDLAVPGLPHRVLRVVLDADTGSARYQTSAPAFAGPRTLTLKEARGVLNVWARRLKLGFEFTEAHGLDRCRTRSAVVVRCRWSSGGEDTKPNERNMDVTLGPAGYVLTPGPKRPSPKRGRNRNLLDAPFLASA